MGLKSHFLSLKVKLYTLTPSSFYSAHYSAVHTTKVCPPPGGDANITIKRGTTGSDLGSIRCVYGCNNKNFGRNMRFISTSFSTGCLVQVIQYTTSTYLNIMMLLYLTGCDRRVTTEKAIVTIV
jgi:hypothetical protein